MNGKITAHIRGNIAGETKFFNFDTEGKSEVARFSVAMNVRRRDRSGQYADKTLFWDVTVFGSDAKYAHKIAGGNADGLKGVVFIGDGEVDWNDADNGKRYFNVLCRDVAIITRGEKNEAPAKVSSEAASSAPAEESVCF